LFVCLFLISAASMAPERLDIESLTLEQVEKVRTGWYAANNMTLIVVGDLDRLLPAYLERTYSQLIATEPGDHPPLPGISHKADAERTLTKGGLGEGARLHWFFPEPVLAKQHDETYELLQDYLDWTLYSTLRLEDGLSYGPWSEHEVFGDTGFMSLNADLDRGDIDQANQAIRTLTARLQKMAWTRRCSPACSRRPSVGGTPNKASRMNSLPLGRRG
jgi:predicted Zn-dependent peptidase